ncbi:MAG: AraC family transcriptional regulator [Gammaproteobacteria bacterium]|nr:AraC family transcriptional regulator [Gammaproteobacteria bacterium]
MQSIKLDHLRVPQKLVENRISFAGMDSELSIYDTYDAVNRVALDADQLLYCGMMSGRKIMHSAQQPTEQVFLPHESFVMAPGERVEIDFPEASIDLPTSCLTIEIAREKIEKISQRMSDLAPLESGAEGWQYSKKIMHSQHTAATQNLLERMVSVFTENNTDRDVMIDLGVTELIVRLLRNQSRDILFDYCRRESDASGITAAIFYIEKHLSDYLEIGQLTKISCMSRSRLYAEFKKQLGCTPCELQQQLRLKSAAKRIEQGDNITQVCYEMGFASPSHFSRRFSLFFGVSPREFQQQRIKSVVTSRKL